MAVKFEKIVKDTVDTMKKASKPKTSEYDVNGIVKRVDGKTAWVHFDGGIDETPVRMTISARKGDKVRVHVGGGKAYITGNETAPPTDDGEARKATKYAGEAKRAADNAEQTAQKAQKSADEAAVAASDAYDHAEQADENAIEALQSANGKNTLYYSATAPTGGEYNVGDTWFDTSNDYQIHTWGGSAWVGFQLGEDAIADLSITNAKIANGTIQSAKIANLDAGKITTGQLSAARIDVSSISRIGPLDGRHIKIQAVSESGTNYESIGFYNGSNLEGRVSGNSFTVGDADGDVLLKPGYFRTTSDEVGEMQYFVVDMTNDAVLLRLTNDSGSLTIRGGGGGSYTASQHNFYGKVYCNNGLAVTGAVSASNIPSSTINGSRDFTFKNANGNNRKLTLTFDHGILTGWDNSAA